MKKLTVMLLVMTLVFGLAACGNASEKGSNVTETQAQSAEDTGAGNAELNKLYEKENAIIAKHQELWNTVFNNIDKDKAADAGEQNYGTFLETQLDHVKDQFSEADLKKLDKDIEEIKKIEDQVTYRADGNRKFRRPKRECRNIRLSVFSGEGSGWK